MRGVDREEAILKDNEKGLRSESHAKPCISVGDQIPNYVRGLTGRRGKDALSPK